ncbi:hypothetical protein ACJ41O_006705 [Fusarium nematophilum]
MIDPCTKTTKGNLPTVPQGLNEAMKAGQALWFLHDTFILSIGASTVVKVGRSLDPDGITNLQYTNARAPEVPTPACLGSLVSGQRTYVFMSKAEGMTLETVWAQLSTAQKLSVQEQLNTMFSALRAKSPDSEGDDKGTVRIGSFVPGTCKDMRRWHRVCEETVRCEGAFNDFLCSEPGRTDTPWIRMIRSFMKEDHRIVWTHGDLHPRNIMVKWETDQGEELGE